MVRRGTRAGIALLVCLPLWLTAGSLPAGETERGDTNRDGSVDLSDIIRLFEWLMLNGSNEICAEAADINNDGRVDITDAILILRYMFLGSYPTDGEPGQGLPEHLVDCLDGASEMKIVRLQATVLSPVSAMVTWETAKPSTTVVRCEREVSPDDVAVEAEEISVEERVTYHQVLLKGLVPGATYRYLASSELATGEGAESETLRFKTLAENEYTVRPDHPRLFLTAEDLPILRSRIAPAGEARRLWLSLTEWCDGRVERPIEDLTLIVNVASHVRAMTFAALLGKNKVYRAKAIEAALFLAKNGPGDELRGETEAIAYVYDWLNDHLDEDAKATLRKSLLRYCARLKAKSRDDEFVTGLSHGHNKTILLGALAVHGEAPAAAALIKDAVSNYRYGFLATWRRFASNGGGSSKGWWYTSHALPFELEFFAAWRSATGEDLFATEREWCEGLLDWFLFGLRGDESFIREGDARLFNGINAQDRHFGLLLAKEYGNSRGQWFADQATETAGVWGPHIPFDILWSDPEVEPEAPSGPSSKLFRNTGVAVLRESWAKDAVVASFRSAEAYTLGHTHRDNASFSIYYKGGQALDSGIYDSFDSKHHDNYYVRTVAHNTITVFDPEEEFSLYGEKHSNDGGQRWLVSGEDVPHHWPPRAEDTVERSRGYRLGGITRYEDTPAYTYLVGNAGPSYRSTKVKRFLRHFLWLKSVSTWAHPVVIVFDDVVATKPSFRKAYLLHTQNKPRVEGRLVSSENGEGKLFQWTLMPKQVELGLVGGRGKEFWVDGKNYPPIRAPQHKEEAGAWRVEVSPETARVNDRFLHALYPADLDAPAPEEPSTFTAGTHQGCRIADWTLLFDFGLPVEDAKYESPLASSHHLVFGAAPEATYDVALNGELQETLEATFTGTLSFDLHAPGEVHVSRRVE
ncbi:MAG TPA: heparinase II/III family protein [Planctomycetota bacterium]|nr:heparinase II/III family protein [Planctomycetota bacterium]